MMHGQKDIKLTEYSQNLKLCYMKVFFIQH